MTTLETLAHNLKWVPWVILGVALVAVAIRISWDKLRGVFGPPHPPADPHHPPAATAPHAPEKPARKWPNPFPGWSSWQIGVFALLSLGAIEVVRRIGTNTDVFWSQSFLVRVMLGILVVFMVIFLPYHLAQAMKLSGKHGGGGGGGHGHGHGHDGPTISITRIMVALIFLMFVWAMYEGYRGKRGVSTNALITVTDRIIITPEGTSQSRVPTWTYEQQEVYPENGQPKPKKSERRSMRFVGTFVSMEKPWSFEVFYRDDMTGRDEWAPFFYNPAQPETKRGVWEQQGRQHGYWTGEWKDAHTFEGYFTSTVSGRAWRFTLKRRMGIAVL